MSEKRGLLATTLWHVGIAGAMSGFSEKHSARGFLVSTWALRRLR